MRFTITLTAATDDRPTSGISIAVIERDDDTLTIDDLGLRIAESKRLLAALQLAVVQTQALDWCRRQRACPCCGSARQIKDHRSIMVRTPFGKIAVPSTRFRRCTCKPTAGIAAPIVAALPERVTPDLLELEARWASLASYGITAERLADVLPIGDAINATTIRQDTLRVAERLEAELGTERRCFIEGCEADWTDGPLPGPPVTVGIDGGYVRSWYDRPNNFEVIVGKSVVDPGEDGEISEPTRRFGFVVGHDDRPRRRLHELLLEQGVGMDREITFMSDGGRNVRNLQWDMRPNAEHVLDYFHIAMRVTVMQQIARGLPPPFETDKDVAVATLERVRHFLWHGNWRRALDLIGDVETRMLGATDPDVTDEPMSHPQVSPQARNLLKHLREFESHISANASMIPNYGERRRYGEAVSTAFVESTVNQVVAKRFAKKQQMQWTPRGVHLLVQLRVRTLDGTLANDFQRWRDERKAA